MTRFARDRRVFFFEEPEFEDITPHLRSSICATSGVNVITPILRHESVDQYLQLRALLDSLLDEHGVEEFVGWYYTPMALDFSRHLRPAVTVYDCMDELSAFAGAPAVMRDNEQELFRRADLVFTGGASLYDSKRKQHSNTHLFPSSVDVSHFAKARAADREPADQADIPRPRFGYAGVIDERMDTALLRSVAAMRPDWHFVLLGPVVKIDPGSLPRARNIHYLGLQAYADLPAYFSGWDIGILPFALNESTRFISPTKTPEYLAAGLRVISSPIRDVVTPYGDLGLVEIVKDPGEFVRVADSVLANPQREEYRVTADRFLARSSWDKTWTRMNELIDTAVISKRAAAVQGRAHSEVGRLVEGPNRV